MKTKVKTENKKVYLCKEGSQTFKMKAKDIEQAKQYAQMYNAVIIKEIK